MDLYLFYKTVKVKVYMEGNVDQNLQAKRTNTSKIRVNYNKTEPN